MKTQTLLNYIGCTSANRDLDEFLTTNRIHARPATFEDIVAEEEEDNDGDEFFDERRIEQEAENSLIIESERNGLVLIFEHRSDYEQMFGPVAESGAFVLKELSFNAQGFRGALPYVGTLPGSLAFGDDSKRVSTVLQSTPTTIRAIHDTLTARYVFNGWILNAGFDKHDHLCCVHIRRPHYYDRLAMAHASPETRDPNSTQTFISILGRPRQDPLVVAAFSELGIEADLARPRFCPDTVGDLTKSGGITLYFRDADELPVHTMNEDETWFIGVSFKRMGDLGSAGYWGKLPFGLSFADSSADILKKIPDPLDGSESDELGHYMWKFEHFILHVMYSLIDDQLYRVTLFSPLMEQELFAQV